MQRIKLNERQLLMLKKLQEDESKKKVLRINEDQFNRLFKGNSTPSSNISKSIKKAGIKEVSSKEIDLVEFAQELIVFIKDVLSRPKTMPFSSYWEGIGISKSKLFKMAKKEGLLALADENSEMKEYVTPKIGFRKKIKELYKKLNEKNIRLNEFGDAGYPAGADMDSNAPYNQDDAEPEDEQEAIKADREIMKMIYFSDEMDGTGIFTYKNEMFYISLGDIDAELTEPYEDVLGWPNGETLNHYVNDKLSTKELQVFKQNAPKGQLALITPKVKQKLIKYYGKDEKLVSLLNQLPESTGAASSGAFVGGMTAPTKQEPRLSPEKALQGISEDNAIDPTYTHFGVFLPTGKVVTGWEYNDIDKDDIKHFSREDIIDNFPDFKPSQFKIITIRGLKQKGIDPFDANNWELPNTNIDETTSTGSVGGDSGSFAYDAPAGDGSSFWNAGNKLNKGKADKPSGMPIVRGGSMTEGTSKEEYEKNFRPKLVEIVTEGIKVGQVYKNMAARRKVQKIDKLRGIITVRQWGDGNAREFNINKKEWGNWELIHEHKVLKITEAQLKRILESENMNSTAYPDGEMVGFDDCTKLNNNKDAQNGGCSQGAIDNVVKTTKTKSSVVAEGQFNPNIGAGSIYAIEVKANGAKVMLTQDNGQTVVVHHDEIPNLIKILDNFY